MVLEMSRPANHQPSQPSLAGTIERKSTMPHMVEPHDPPLGRVTFRPFLAGDVVQLQLQPSQHLTLGLSRPRLSMDDGRDLEESSVDCWTAVAADGRILACTGFRMLWPAGDRTNGHAVAWALLASDKGAAFLTITRFLKSVVAVCSLTRIEAIVRDAHKAEGRWLKLLGFDYCAPLPSWGPDGELHHLYQRVKDFVGGPASSQPGQPADAGHGATAPRVGAE